MKELNFETLTGRMLYAVGRGLFNENKFFIFCGEEGTYRFVLEPNIECCEKVIYDSAEINGIDTTGGHWDGFSEILSATKETVYQTPAGAGPYEIFTTTLYRILTKDCAITLKWHGYSIGCGGTTWPKLRALI
jgi:hypothetical protein